VDSKQICVTESCKQSSDLVEFCADFIVSAATRRLILVGGGGAQNIGGGAALSGKFPNIV